MAWHPQTINSQSENFRKSKREHRNKENAQRKWQKPISIAENKCHKIHNKTVKNQKSKTQKGLHSKKTWKVFEHNFRQTFLKLRLSLSGMECVNCVSVYFVFFLSRVGFNSARAITVSTCNKQRNEQREKKDFFQRGNCFSFVSSVEGEI